MLSVNSRNYLTLFKIILFLKIFALEVNPRPSGVKKLQVFEYYRIRMGDYRIVYSINDKIHLIKVLDLGHRKDIYR